MGFNPIPRQARKALSQGPCRITVSSDCKSEGIESAPVCANTCALSSGSPMRPAAVAFMG